MKRPFAFGGRSRALAAVVLLAALIGMEAVMGPSFVFVVSVALVAAPLINWRAFFKLRMARRIRRETGRPIILSLRAAYYSALVVAVASTCIALVAGFSVLRAIPALAIPPIPREVYLIGLAFPLLLLTGPAIEWLLLFRTIWPNES